MTTVNQRTIKVEWGCVNGHENWLTQDVPNGLDTRGLMDLITDLYAEGFSMDLECKSCGEKGTEGGTHLSSTDPAVQILIDFNAEREYYGS